MARRSHQQRLIANNAITLYRYLLTSQTCTPGLVIPTNLTQERESLSGTEGGIKLRLTGKKLQKREKTMSRSEDRPVQEDVAKDGRAFGLAQGKKSRPFVGSALTSNRREVPVRPRSGQALRCVARHANFACKKKPCYSGRDDKSKERRRLEALP